MRAPTFNSQMWFITVWAAKHYQRFLLQVLSTSSDSRFFWWSWMIGIITFSGAKQRTTRLFLPTTTLTQLKLAGFSLSSVVGTELSYIHKILRLRAREDSVRSGVFLGINS